MDRHLELINKLADDVVDADVPIDELTGTYAKFILATLETEELKDIAGAHFEWIAESVKMATDVLEGHVSREEGKARSLEAVRLGGKVEDPQLSSLFRSVVLCFTSENDWNPDTAQDETPLAPYYFTFRRVLPDIAGAFDKYFREKLTL